jgi:hypothetical protein
MSACYSVLYADQLSVLETVNLKLSVFLVFHIHKGCDLWFDHYCLGMGMWPNQLV